VTTEREAGAAAGGLPSRLGAARAFVEGVRAELRRVTWPTRDELLKATRMIVILSAVLGIAIGLVDLLLNLLLVRGVAALSR
jgi:preprotein translocase subunit SecE